MRRLLFNSTTISTGLLLFSLNLAAVIAVPEAAAQTPGAGTGDGVPGGDDTSERSPLFHPEGDLPPPPSGFLNFEDESAFLLALKNDKQKWKDKIANLRESVNINIAEERINDLEKAVLENLLKEQEKLIKLNEADEIVNETDKLVIQEQAKIVQREERRLVALWVQGSMKNIKQEHFNKILIGSAFLEARDKEEGKKEPSWYNTFLWEKTTAPSASNVAVAADIMAVRNVGNVIRTRIPNRKAVSSKALGNDLGYGYNMAAEDVALGAEIWIQGFGGTAKVSDAGFSTDNRNGGVLLGIDSYVSDNMAIGVAGVFNKSDSTISGYGGLTGANSTTYGTIVYLGYDWDNGLNFNGSAGYLHSGIKQSRRNSFSDIYSSDFTSNTIYVSSDMSRDYLVNDIVFTPTIGLTLTRINYAEYTETATGKGPLPQMAYDIFAQTVPDLDVISVVGLTGMNIAKKMELEGKSVTVNLSGELLYEFNDRLGHYTLPYDDDDERNNIHAPDSLLANIGGSVEIDFNKSASTQLGYSATLGKNTTEHNINGHFSIKF